MNNLVGVFLVLASASAFVQQNTSVVTFKWLEGEWKLQGAEAYEVWQWQNDTLLAGASFRQKGEEMVRDENIVLTSRSNSFYYIPQVFTQNQAKPVEFLITAYTDTSFTAENPAHDFPQKITYTLLDRQNLRAIIKGHVKGKARQVEFLFIKQ